MCESYNMTRTLTQKLPICVHMHKIINWQGLMCEGAALFGTAFGLMEFLMVFLT